MAALVMYANGKTNVLDKMEDGTEEKGKEEQTEWQNYAADDEKKSFLRSVLAKDVATPKDLLPSDENSQWAALKP